MDSAREQEVFMRVARFERTGPADVIDLVDYPYPQAPEPDEVVIAVIAASLNPADSKTRSGAIAPGLLPGRLGRECVGVVREIGANVTDLQPEDLVVATGEGLLADVVTAARPLVAALHRGVSADQGACLPVAGQTAWCALESQAVEPGEVVVVSAAAGGVGHILCQLLLERGVRVIGTASSRHHEYLRALGVEPVEYGPELAIRLQALCPEGIDHVFDQSGEEMVEAALSLGVPPDTINSISGVGPRYGVATVGRVGLDETVIRQLSERVADGRLNLLIRTFPFSEVQKAFIELDEMPLRGKIVVRMDADGTP